MPADAEWATRYDDKLAGSSAVPKGHELAGEIAPGKTPIVHPRQDGPGGLMCYYTGKLVANDRIVGARFDTRGRRGTSRGVMRALPANGSDERRPPGGVRAGPRPARPVVAGYRPFTSNSRRPGRVVRLSVGDGPAARPEYWVELIQFPDFNPGAGESGSCR